MTQTCSRVYLIIRLSVHTEITQQHYTKHLPTPTVCHLPHTDPAPTKPSQLYAFKTVRISDQPQKTKQWSARLLLHRRQLWVCEQNVQLSLQVVLEASNTLQGLQPQQLTLALRHGCIQPITCQPISAGDFRKYDFTP